MVTTGDLLSDDRLKALEEEKEALLKEQKLLNADIRAMTLEMRKRSGQPAPGEPSSLATAQELAQLSADLTGLQLEEMSFHLVSAEDGVSVTRWRVRVVSEEADAEICLQYDSTKDEHSNVTCSGLEVVDFTPSLGPLVDAAGENPRDILFGIYQLGRLTAERKEALGDGAPAEHTEPALLQLPGRKRLYWGIDFIPEVVRYRQNIAVENSKGQLLPLPEVLQELLNERGTRALIEYVQSL